MDDMQAVLNYLNVEGSTILFPKDFSNSDSDLQFDGLYQKLGTLNGVVVLRGFTSQAALLGSTVLQQMLKTLAGFTSSKCKVIVLCYQCQEELKFSDSRQRNLVYDIEGALATRSKLQLISEGFPLKPGDKVSEGIENVGLLLEQGLPTIRIRTKCLENARILMNNLWIDAMPSSDGQNLSFILPKKKDETEIILYDGDDEISEKIHITVKNKVGGSNNDMGGIL